MTIPYRNLMSKVLCLLTIFTIIVGCRRVEDTSGSLEVIKTKSGIEMVKIPQGWFDMGSSDGSPDESPVHKIWISSFWMDRFEVVQEQFKKFQISDPSHFKDPNNPLEQINWTDATMFCNERSLAEGLEPCYDEETWECNFQANGYRLPTEAEWEYACRAGTTTKFSFGSDVRNLKDHAWFADNSSGKTHTVGQKKSNPWGLYDMYGNVSEWCEDVWHDTYEEAPNDGSAWTDESGLHRVIRGGNWTDCSIDCRSSAREKGFSSGTHGYATGLRVVREYP